MEKLSNKFLVPLFEPSLPHLTSVCLWIKFKLLLLKCGLDILTIFLSSGHMVSKNFKHFCVVLMSSIMTPNLHMSQAKKALYFLTLKLVLKTVRLLQYVKSTDHHQYFYYLSAHPNHIKRSVV